MYIHIYICVCVYIYICIYVFMCVCVCVYPGEWKDHLRSKLGAEGRGVADEGGGEGGGEGEGREEFRPFDYAAVNADAEPKSKQQKKLDAQAMLDGHFNPHAGLDGKSKQVFVVSVWCVCCVCVCVFR